MSDYDCPECDVDLDEIAPNKYRCPDCRMMYEKTPIDYTLRPIG